jgi:hypothetical protein
MMSTQSGDDTKPPTALAKLHLEDGSTLVGRSFGCHESVSGEVRVLNDVIVFSIVYLFGHSNTHTYFRHLTPTSTMKWII